MIAATYILKNPAFKPGKGMAEFIYLADRWQTNTTDFGRYLWLPLVVNADGAISSVSVTNPASWKYDEPVPLKTDDSEDAAPTAALLRRNWGINIHFNSASRKSVALLTQAFTAIRQVSAC